MSSATAVENVGRLARLAYEASQLLDANDRVEALRSVSAAISQNEQAILAANARDVQAAREQVTTGAMPSTMLKRLDLRSSIDKFASMIRGISDVAALPDPNDRITYASRLDEGLDLYRVTCPIGVLLVIFEARPEVIVNITALAIKSGNAAILKGGKESLNTQIVLSRVIQEALAKTKLPSAYIQTVQTREDVGALLSQHKYVDLVIPRGSNALVRSIQQMSQIPVMGHADGLCTVYVDESADVDKAIRVVVDSKCSYPAACNSAETLIVHEAALYKVFVPVAEALLASGVTLRCDVASLTALSAAGIQPAAHAIPSKSDDYDTEFLDLTMAVAVVPSIAAALSHISAHSSHHTDSIITENEQAARIFTKGLDSAGVFVNASTRFADGFRYGFGTEVGVATGKTHARGPVGLEGLVIYKYIIRGDGNATQDYGSEEDQKRIFKHQMIEAAALPY